MKLIKAKAKGVQTSHTHTAGGPPERKGRPAVTAESQPSGLQTPRILTHRIVDIVPQPDPIGAGSALKKLASIFQY